MLIWTGWTGSISSVVGGTFVVLIGCMIFFDFLFNSIYVYKTTLGKHLEMDLDSKLNFKQDIYIKKS